MIPARSRAGVAVGLLPLLTLLAACEEPPVPIGVEYSLVEELRVGSIDDPSTAFTSIGGLIVDGDSLLYLLQPRESLVRVLDRDGNSLGTLGRQGEGPGEFTSASSFGLTADGFWVQDRSLQIIQYLTRDGTEVGRVGFDPVPVFDGVVSLGGPARPWGAGTLGIVDRFSSAWLRAQTRIPFPVLEFDGNGVVVDTLTYLTWPSIKGQLSYSSGDRTTYFGIPLHEIPSHAFSPTRDVIGILDRPVDPGNPGYRVTLVAAGADTILSAFHSVSPIPLEGDLLDEFIGRLGDRLSPEMRRIAVDAFGGFPHLPPANRLTLDSELRAWVSRETVFDEPVRWDVLDPDDGSLRFWVTLPARARVLWAQRSTVWVSELGALDEPQLVRYRVAEPEAVE